MKRTRPEIVTIMQTRCGSSRLPSKVLLPLQNKALFVRQAERMQAAACIGTLVVATTTDSGDDIIEDMCREANMLCFRGRATDVLDRHYEAARLYGADIVVKIPSDCPLIDPLVIDKVISFFLNNRYTLDYASNLHPASYPDGNDVEVMHFEVLETAWRNAAQDFEREHTTPYIWERPEIFKTANVCMEGGVDYSLTQRWTIDYPEDYVFIKRVYDELYEKNALFGVADILKLVEQHNDIYTINSHLAGVNWYRHHLGQLKTISALQTKIL